MVAKILVDSDIESGRRLIEKLAASNIPLKAALWVYHPDFQRYRLLISSPFYDQNGPSASYRLIVNAIDSLSQEDQSRLQEVKIVGEDDALINAVTQSVHLDPGISGIRYSGSPGREYIDDAWIYRLN